MVKDSDTNVANPIALVDKLRTVTHCILKYTRKNQCQCTSLDLMEDIIKSVHSQQQQLDFEQQQQLKRSVERLIDLWLQHTVWDRTCDIE